MKKLFLYSILATGMAAASPALAAPAVYHFNDDAQGWTIVGTANGMDNVTAGGGEITWDYVTPTAAFDPILDSPGDLTINAAIHHWLRLDVEIVTPASAGPQLFQIFFAAANGAFAEGTSRTFTVTPNAGLQTIIFDMAEPQMGRDPFTGTIVDFRIDPGVSEADLVGGTGRIEVIALTDDADFDGMNDDLEIQIFGDITVSDGDTDTDGDGIDDRTELALGLDPLVDEGISVPVGGALAALAGISALALFYVRRR